MKRFVSGPVVSLVWLSSLMNSCSVNAFTTTITSPKTRTNPIHGSGSISSISSISNSSIRKSLHLNMMIAPDDITSTTTDIVNSVSASSFLLSDFSPTVPGPGEVTYSKASYYTVLGLYGLSFPGLWSQIKRSTKAKVKRKTFVTAGENLDGKTLRQQAGEIMAFMKANNYEVVEAGETIKFNGLVKRSSSQAFFLTFCTFLGMISLALVLGIQFQGAAIFGFEINWYFLTLISPYAGIYYWKAGDRIDEFEFKLGSNDDETENEITVQGNDEEIERMWRELEWLEKGMVKIPGLLEE